jgi:chemotaxis protein MotB
MATFADLMNLLLCFFVLLFSMSTVDAEKFEKIAMSMANSIGVFEGGQTSIGSGNLISAGMTQMNELDEFFTNMGKASIDNGTDVEENKEPQDSNSSQNTEEETAGGNGDAKLDQALERIEEEMTSVSEGMYDEVSDMTEQYNLGDYVELSIDPEYRFVQLTLKGSVLFDSGKADLKDVARPILSKIGEILLKFEGYTVEIIGHTDNVPMSSENFKDNNWLSSARALNAAEFMIDNSKLDPSNVKYSGRGEYEPIASNETADGRAKNRRIEIKIYNEYSGE